MKKSDVEAEVRALGGEVPEHATIAELRVLAAGLTGDGGSGDEGEETTAAVPDRFTRNHWVAWSEHTKGGGYAGFTKCTGCGEQHYCRGQIRERVFCLGCFDQQAHVPKKRRAKMAANAKKTNGNGNGDKKKNGNGSKAKAATSTPRAQLSEAKEKKIEDVATKLHKSKKIDKDGAITYGRKLQKHADGLRGSAPPIPKTLSSEDADAVAKELGLAKKEAPASK